MMTILFIILIYISTNNLMKNKNWIGCRIK